MEFRALIITMETDEHVDKYNSVNYITTGDNLCYCIEQHMADSFGVGFNGVEEE